MTKSTLANLYRQATRNTASSALPDADVLIALARGERPADAERVVAEVAQSALQSDLLHFARALEPASSALSEELAAVLGDVRTPAPHPRTHAVPSRVAAGRKPVWRRIAVGLAAALVAGVALWTQQHRVNQPMPVAKTAPVPDRIFAAFDDRAVASKAKGDQIFRGDFRGDVIFRASGT